MRKDIIVENPKHEIRNPKQYLNLNFQNLSLRDISRRETKRFKHLDFIISNLFRISIFEFSAFVKNMPIIKSAKKALRQNISRRKKNIKKKIELKSAVKQYKKLVASGEKDKAKTYLSTVYKKLDKSAKANLIKKNKASRVKSRLSKLIK